MKFGKTPSSWIDLQNQVCLLLTEAGFTANSPKTIQTVRGKIEVDVYAEHNQDLISKIICECKYWETNIPQEKVHAFRTVVHDSGAMLGLIITKTGFQTGAYEAAKYTNVQLLTWTEFCELIFEKWIATQLEKLRMLSAALFYFSDDYDFPYENVKDELQDEFYHLRKSVRKFREVGLHVTKGDLINDNFHMKHYKMQEFEYIEDYLRFLLDPLEKAYNAIVQICRDSNIRISKRKFKHYCFIGPRWDDETDDLDF